MRSRSLTTQHEAAVARRLELLSNELAEVRDTGTDSTARGAGSWTPHAHTRIRAVPDLHPDDGLDQSLDGSAELVPDEASAASVVRLPGRHASRRNDRGWADRRWADRDRAIPGWADRVPGPLRLRVALGPGQVAVVAVLVAAALAVTCWWLVRGGSHDQPVPASLTTPAAALATPAGGASDEQAPTGSTDETTTGPGGAAQRRAKVVVDVTGRVRRPGIAVLRQGARIIDAIRAAGGVRHGVDTSSLNLAQVLTDGEQIVVGAAAGSPAAPAGTGSVPASPPSGSPAVSVVDLNTADETTLESLPEVGPVTAAAIIAWRTQHGSFTSVDQLLDVDGIGDATLAKLTPYVTI